MHVVRCLQAAAASGGANAVAAAAADMDMASVLATFPPDLREEVLANADEEVSLLCHNAAGDHAPYAGIDWGSTRA